MINLQDNFDKIYNDHLNTVYRVCFTYMRGRKMDIEDAVQESFIRLMKYGKPFNDDEHVKAWLIVTAGNICKNMLKRKYRSDVEYEETFKDCCDCMKDDEVLQSVLMLPRNERISVYLYYYEGYNAKEIGQMINKKQSTVWAYLKSGRDILRDELKECAL